MIPGMSKMADAKVDELSGGELQRVWLATCLAQDYPADRLRIVVASDEHASAQEMQGHAAAEMLVAAL